MAGETSSVSSAEMSIERPPGDPPCVISSPLGSSPFGLLAGRVMDDELHMLHVRPTSPVVLLNVRPNRLQGSINAVSRRQS